METLVVKISSGSEKVVPAPAAVPGIFVDYRGLDPDAEISFSIGVGEDSPGCRALCIFVTNRG